MGKDILGSNYTPSGGRVLDMWSIQVSVGLSVWGWTRKKTDKNQLLPFNFFGITCDEKS